MGELRKIIEEKSKLEAENSNMRKELGRWTEKMKAVEMRQQYNDKLRRNWQAQLQQMEQALLLSNQINNQTRTKFNETIRQKDVEIAKLQSYVTTILQRQRTAKKARRVEKPVPRRPATSEKAVPRQRSRGKNSDPNHQPIE